jgi:hypothetical protein
VSLTALGKKISPFSRNDKKEKYVIPDLIGNPASLSLHLPRGRNNPATALSDPNPFYSGFHN